MRISRILLASVCLFVFKQSSNAQWSGTSNETITSGKVGIGTTNPNEPLTLECTAPIMASFKHNGLGNSAVRIGTNNGFMNLGVGATTLHPYIWSQTNNFFIGNDGDPTLFINGMGNGNVGIGTTDTKGYKLAVNGSAIFTRVKVATYGNWADYVFTASYRLRPLSEVEQYIKQHNHLPEVPSAEEVEKNGLDIADNQATLLKKIEELTLYVIEQNKRIQMLESKLETLQNNK